MSILAIFPSKNSSTCRKQLHQLHSQFTKLLRHLYGEKHEDKIITDKFTPNEQLRPPFDYMNLNVHQMHILNMFKVNSVGINTLYIAHPSEA